MKLVCSQKKKILVKYVFNLSISCSVKLKKICAHRHIFTYIFKILKNVLLIVVHICHSLSFLSLQEKDFPKPRNWWAAVCVHQYPLLNGHWPARPFGNALADTSEAQTSSTARQIPFWKQLGYDPKRDNITLRVLDDSVSIMAIFSMSYSFMEINSVTLNRSIGWWLVWIF